MIKRISYIFVLFISLFVVSNIKALECTDSEGNVYKYNASGFIVSLSGDNLTYYVDGTPGPTGKPVRNRTSGKYSVEYSFHDTSSTKLHSPQINPDVCPKPDELHYEVNTKNVYTVTIDAPYYTREKNTVVTPTDTTIGGCSDITDMNQCKTDSQYSCVWVDKTTSKVSDKQENGYCNVDTLQYVQCGKNSKLFDIPIYVPRIVSFVINFLKIVTPIILVFTSAFSLLKAITANKEDEMEKAKKVLVRRIAIAALIFFTITITQFVIDRVAEKEESEDLGACFNCFINNQCQTNKYYKNSIGGEYKCFTVEDKKPISNCH